MRSGQEEGEYALLVRTDLQGCGIGWQLLTRLVDYAKAERIGRIEGIVLEESSGTLHMCREFGFTLSSHPDEPRLMLAALDLGQKMQSRR